MERFLLVSGRIISFIFIAVGVLLLVAMLSGILLVNATAIVPAFGQNLVDNHVIDDLGSAVWQTFTDSIPPTIQIGHNTVETAPLVTAFRRALEDIINSGLPLDEWLRTRADQVFFRVVTEVQGAVAGAVQAPVENLQQALSDSNAAPLVNLLLAALDQCTDAQTAQLEQLLGTGPRPNTSVAVSFLCRPPESVGVAAQDLMRNAVTLALAEIANQAAGRIEERLSEVDLLSNITFDTPLGPAQLDWPNVRVGSGFFSVSVPLPESIVQAVEEFAAGIQSRANAVIAEATQQVQEAQATLQAAGSALATEVTTRTPPTATAISTPTPAPTFEPTLTPAEAEAQRQAVSPLEQRVLTLFEAIGASLSELSSQLTTILLLILGIPLLLHSYLQLYLMRSIRWWLLWIGLTLAISGFVLFAINDRLTTSLITPLAASSSDAVPAALVPVTSAAVESLRSAIESSLIGPFQTAGLFLAMLGVALVAVAAFLFWQARQKAHHIEPVPTADETAAAAEPPTAPDEKSPAAAAPPPAADEKSADAAATDEPAGE